MRPQHRMHGHTGFLVTARRLAPGVVPPERKRRPAKGAYARGGTGHPGSTTGGSSRHPGTARVDAIDRDPADAWTPEALGERVKSDKRIRRVRRSVTETSDAVVTVGLGSNCHGLWGRVTDEEARDVRRAQRARARGSERIGCGRARDPSRSTQGWRPGRAAEASRGAT